MERDTISETTTIEEELLGTAALVSGDLVAMSKEQIMENKNGKLFVQKDRVGLHFSTPAAWWGMVSETVGLTRADEAQFGAATWQAQLFGKAMDLIGLTDVVTSKQTSAQRKDEEAQTTTVFTVTWDDLAKVLGNDRASIAWKNAEFRESRKQTNRVLYGNNFAEKQQRFAKYQGECILMLLQGKETAYPQGDFNTVFVQETRFMRKNPKARATKAQYEMVTTGVIEGSDVRIHDNAWAKVDVIVKGKKLNRQNAVKHLVELGVPEDELGNWDEINAAAIEKGIARVHFPEIADLLGGGPMGIMASLSRINDPQHESRMLNWKILLGYKSNRFYGNDTEGLDAEILEMLRENCLALGVYTPERDERFSLFEVGEKGLPSCDYHGNEAEWQQATSPLGWRDVDAFKAPDSNKWIDTVPFPALEFWGSGVKATWEAMPIGTYHYPIFELEEVARPNAK